MGLQFFVFFSPTQRDQSSSVGRRRYDDGMSSGVGTWEECWKTEKNERSSWNVHFIGMCKEKTLQQKIHLVIFWVPGAHGNCNPSEQTKETRRIRFICPHHRVSLQNSNLFLKLAKKMKIKISQNMGISQKSILHTCFHNSLSHRRFLLRNAPKVGANILWGIAC